MSIPNKLTNTVDIKYVANLLNCSPKTVLEKAGLGEIPGAKIGKSWVFKLSDISKYFDDEIEKQTQIRRKRYLPQPRRDTRRGYEEPLNVTRKLPKLKRFS